MPAKYHADPTGRLLPCTAQAGNCKYGNHYSARAYANITASRPQNDREMKAWFNNQVAQQELKIKPISERAGWGYNGDFMSAVLKVTRIEGAASPRVALLHELRAKYGNPRAGGFRAVFDRGDGYLIKVATVPVAQSMNAREARLAQDPSAEVKMARCWEEELSGVRVLVMEKVKVPRPEQLRDMVFPEWVKQVDYQQVGYDKAGELVAYDL